jgi:hypothetical protein
MRAIDPDELYELLPVLYRLRDVDEGHPLQALLRIIGEQAAIVDQNIDRLWDDLFIETSQDWVIPYIGDLVANNLLHDAGTRARVDVAKTIYYRRRKGTLPMLEELARDVTGWGGHAVEFFELLGWTQNLNHLRSQAGWPDMRNVDALDRIDGPFDQVSHTVDVRTPSSGEGWHNIPNIGFFLYRLQSYPQLGTVLTDPVTAASTTVRPMALPGGGGPNTFFFSSVGARGPLFNRWRREGDSAGLAQEVHVPGPIRARTFGAELDRARDGAIDLDYYGDGLSLAVFADGVEVPASQVICKDLSTWQAPTAGSGLVAVDVTSARMAFEAGSVPDDVTVQFHRGFSGDVGGGPYDRRRSGSVDDFVGFGPDTVADPEAYGTLIQVSAISGVDDVPTALGVWTALGKPPCVIQIEDDRTYSGAVNINMAGATRLVIQASDGRAPTIIGRVKVTGNSPDARLVLDGLLVAGHLRLTGDLEELRVSHCTFVPGRTLRDDNGLPASANAISIAATTSNKALSVTLYRSITGPIRLPEEMEGLVVREGIVDGMGTSAIARFATKVRAGPPTKLYSVTIFGPVYVRSMEMATEVVFTDKVTVKRTQGGCVRFSFVPPGSRTPRRYRCQPDMALGVDGLTAMESERIRARLVPAFTSSHYGDPGYAQLSIACPVEIRTGAENESEIGAFSFLRQPQRETNLAIRLDEYLPFGLEPATIFVT